MSLGTPALPSSAGPHGFCRGKALTATRILTPSTSKKLHCEAGMHELQAARPAGESVLPGGLWPRAHHQRIGQVSTLIVRHERFELCALLFRESRPARALSRLSAAATPVVSLMASM